MISLTVAHLSKSYRKEVLRKIDLTVPSGSVVALLGENGSGKTTLLTCMLGLQNHAGIVTVVGGERGLPAHGQIIGMTDEFLLYPRWTVEANLCYFLNDRRPFSNPMVDRLVSPELRGVRAGRLSTGQAKLVMLAIVFGASAQVLLLDEFVNGVDEKARQVVKECLLHIRDVEERIVVATGHDLAVLEDVATHAFLMREGALVDLTPKMLQAGTLKGIW